MSIDVGDKVCWIPKPEWVGVVEEKDLRGDGYWLTVRWDNSGTTSYHGEKNHRLVGKDDSYEMDA